jgi:hypothetical protein
VTIEGTEKYCRQPRMFDQPDSQHRGRAKHARKNTARREQERDNRSAIKHRSAEQPLSNESNQGRTEQAFEDSKKQRESRELPPPLADGNPHRIT